MNSPRFLAISAAVILTSCAQHRPMAAVKTPQAPQAMERQVLNAVDAGDGDVELRAMRARVIAEPGDLAARLALGQIYERRGYPELAVDHYRWAVEHSPDSADAHLMLARALDHTGDSAAAISSLSQFLESHPQNGPTLYSWLGIMRDDKADWKGSEAAYRTAMAKAPEDRDYLHNNLGFALLKQGRSSEAAVEFRAALKLNPRSEIARDNLGIALASNPGAGNEKEAILNWQALNEPATAHSNFAAVLIEQGRYAEARKELAVALQYNQANAAALKNLELLAGLDGKPATIPAAEPKGAWTKWKTVLRQWFGGADAAPAVSSESSKSASTFQSSESKQ